MNAETSREIFFRLLRGALAEKSYKLLEVIPQTDGSDVLVVQLGTFIGATHKQTVMTKTSTINSIIADLEN